MNITDDLGIKPLLASCPKCHSQKLFCGKVETDLKSLKNKEVLYCRGCKFVISVDEFKELLFCP